MAANTDETASQSQLGSLCQVDDLGDIGQVVARKRDKIRLPLCDQTVIVGVALDLQIDDSHRVVGTPRRLRHQFEAQWFKTQKDVRVEQRTRMNEKQSHLDLPGSIMALGIRGLSGCCVMPLSWSFSLPAIHPPAYDQQRTNEARQRDDQQEGILVH